MSNDKMSKEELKKLEDEAYYELCQIIAEAIQTQDIGLLDTRIAAWKSKYKKLLDGSNPNFKKRIEYLLNYYYSEVTQYILSQIRIKEKKVIENQAKAIRKLYLLIKNTNDLATLKKEVEKWKQKYPVDSFLKMYQKRIESYTKVKNLEENAFDQEQAFKDLVEVSKSNEYLDDLKQKLHDWEEKYSINDKYSIDDFLKHQSEVKRFTSEDFLISIAKPEEEILDGIYHGDANETAPHFSSSDSSLSTQAAAYNKLITICKDPNNIDEVFNWVYKNRNIKFNDKYKELILAATYLNYSPTYLSRLSVPEIDLSLKSLSFVNYDQISQIKRYAIISYFNLLLPPDKTVTNTYFNKHIQKLYTNSKKIDTNVSFNTTLLSDEILSLGTEIELNVPPQKKAEPLTTDILIDVSEDASLTIDLSIKPKPIEQKNIEITDYETDPNIDTLENSEKITTEIVKDTDSSEQQSEHVEISKDDAVSVEQPDEEVVSDIPKGTIEQPKGKIVTEISKDDIDTTDQPNKNGVIEIAKESDKSLEDFPKKTTTSKHIDEKIITDTSTESTQVGLEIKVESSEPIASLKQTSEEVVIKTTPTNNSESSSTEIEDVNSELEHETIVAIAPQFFQLVNNYCIEHTLINVIDDRVNNYLQNSSEHAEEDKRLETTYPEQEIRTNSN